MKLEITPRTGAEIVASIVLLSLLTLSILMIREDRKVFAEYDEAIGQAAILYEDLQMKYLNCLPGRKRLELPPELRRQELQEPLNKKGYGIGKPFDLQPGESKTFILEIPPQNLERQ